ncbi:MAG: PCRF domain-containing protein [Planctomycetes bacterium]|nr:PCRF domain-containing protein [Planctomycetota bacterium]
MLELLKIRADRFAELTKLSEDPEVYSDNKLFAKYQRERGGLRDQSEAYENLMSLQAQMDGSNEIINDPEADSEMKEMAEMELSDLKPQYEELYQNAQDLILLDDEDDSSDVIFEIRGAEGGEEATLFARDLMDNYSRWFTAKGMKVEVIDEDDSDGGGLKSATYRIVGENAWKLLKYEGGGHRVQRVPSTESQGRIHTSLATIAVLPEMEEVEIDVKDSDLEVKASRSGGPGGQKVNKTNSRCQMRHKATGVFVDCQATPSFHKNREEALRILKMKLYQMEKAKIDAKQAGSRAAMVGSGQRGDKIRTYNYPQDRCTDHRAKANFSLTSIMSGDLDPIIEACRNWEKEQRLVALTKAAE